MVDTGFGGNIPLTPVPLNGGIVSSANGDFRVKHEKSEHGDYIFYVKLRHKDQDWRIGYAFDSKDCIEDIKDLNLIQKIIIEHPDSSFNKVPLITRLTGTGNMTLTETTYTEWVDGQMRKKDIDQAIFKEIVKEQFGIKFV